MSVVFLPDNQIEVISDNQSLANLVQQHMGFEVAEMVRDLAKEADYAQVRVDSDLLSYESSLESNQWAFRALKDELNALKTEIGKQRLSKPTLIKLIERMESSIDAEL